MTDKQKGIIKALDQVIKLCYNCIEVIYNKDKIDSYNNIILFCETYKKIIEVFHND